MAAGEKNGWPRTVTSGSARHRVRTRSTMSAGPLLDRSRERFLHPREEMGLVGAAGDLHALEFAVEFDINVIVASIFVEVKERPIAPGKGAARALPQLRELAQLGQQRLQLIKVVLRCMPHGSSITSDVRPAQGKLAIAYKGRGDLAWRFLSARMLTGRQAKATTALAEFRLFLSLVRPWPGRHR